MTNKMGLMALGLSMALLSGCGGDGGTSSTSGNGNTSGGSDNDSSEKTVDDILNKRFNHITCTNLLGCSSDATFILTDTTITGTEDNGDAFTLSYTKEPEGDILFLEGNGWSEYTKIISITDTVVTLCSGNDSLEEAQTCSQDNTYWVVPTSTAEFIRTKNATMDTVLTEKTQITNLVNIQDKFLYQITNWNNALSKGAIKIDSSGKLSRYYANSINATISLVPDDADNYYDTSFENDLLHITGKDEGEDEDNTYTVNKYNLSGQSVSVEDFANEEIFDEEGLEDKYAPEKVFSFTSGNMYCTMLWSECWVDEDAMNQIITQSQP